MTTLDALAARLAAGADRIAAANRYPMRVRPLRTGAVGVTITDREYVMTRGEMIALRDLLGVGIAAVGERL